MSTSPELVDALISGGVAGGMSWLTVTFTAIRKFGHLEAKVDAIEKQVNDLSDNRDVVRWSQIGPAMAFQPGLPQQRVGTE